MTVLELTKQLISCPSLTPDDAGCQAILIDRLQQMGFVCETFSFGDVTNLWARLGLSEPLLVFAGHTDVVPTGPEADWSSQPFMPELREGYLFGRGASDMKAALAAMIVACENFLAQSPQFSGSIAFLITSDEEGPAINGTQKVIEVLQKRNEKINYCVIGEPSSEHQLGDQIRVGRRGSLHGKLIIHGKQGHVAHPHLAKNPIHLALLALHELAQMEWDRGNEIFPPTTFQMTNVHGGTGATNVIPGHLEILFNFRYSTAVTPEQLQERTEKILEQHGLHYDLEWKTSALPFFTARGRLIQATQQAIKEVTQLETRLSTGGGTSDGRFIAATGAEIVELGVSHATAHQVDECVRVDDLAMLADVYGLILRKLLSA